MYDLAQDGDPKLHIISDGIFPLKTWLMNPFQIGSGMPALEKNFNYRLSSARMTIVGAFGRLKARWRVLLRRPDVHIETMRTLIYVCFLLHNFCEFSQQGVLEEWLQESDKEEQNLLQEASSANVEQSSNDEHNLAQEQPNSTAHMIRINLARRLFYDNWSVSRSND